MFELVLGDACGATIGIGGIIDKFAGPTCMSILGATRRSVVFFEPAI
jgi:hypothetical protein